jgi:restriction system protein
LVFQCKLYSQPVGNKAVQEVVAARAHESAQFAAVVSNTRYTAQAQQLANTNRVALLHYGDLRNIDALIGLEPYPLPLSTQQYAEQDQR